MSVGPALQLHAESSAGATAMMGDQLATAGISDIGIKTEWSAAPAGATLRLIVNGAVYAQRTVDAEGAQSWSLPSHGSRWFTVELRGDNGTMLAVTNPIFLAEHR
jgi:hypothetical protein